MSASKSLYWCRGLGLCLWIDEVAFKVQLALGEHARKLLPEDPKKPACYHQWGSLGFSHTNSEAINIFFFLYFY